MAEAEPGAAAPRMPEAVLGAAPYTTPLGWALRHPLLTGTAVELVRCRYLLTVSTRYRSAHPRGAVHAGPTDHIDFILRLASLGWNRCSFILVTDARFPGVALSAAY